MNAPIGARRRRRRRVVKIVAGTLGAVIGAALIGAVVTLYNLGKDDPAQYAQRVADIEARYDGAFPQGTVLLVGSSFFEYWTTSIEDLAPLDVVNVGIGGTKVNDQDVYLDRLITPFHPRAVVLYVGSNDMSGIPFFSKKGTDTAQLVSDYIERVHASVPDARIYYVAVTEAPAREIVRSDIQTANRLLAERARTTGSFTFIDTAPALLLPDGSMDGSLFRDDRLHFNEKGYAVFAAAVRAGLAPEYDQANE